MTMRLWLTTYWRRLRTTLLGLVVLLFALDYRPPLPDTHPNWQRFPHLVSTHLVVERILDFDARYGSRYQIPPIFLHDGVVDSPRVTAVRRLGYRVTENTFHFGATNGLSNSGSYTSYPKTGWRFNQEGDSYLEVNVAGEKGYFKDSYSSYEPPVQYIYQYNQPTRRQDTLLLHIEGDDYRLFIR